MNADAASAIPDDGVEREEATSEVRPPDPEVDLEKTRPAPGITLAATPIGNIGDASPRLRAALAGADLIAAEDTRRLRALAAALNVSISAPVLSFYDHNETERIPRLLQNAAAGQRIVVVSDAGMPGVSDPGYRLVAAAVAEDLPVTCLPGPSAVTTALLLSGLPVDRFAFDGFPPRKPGKRRAWFASLAGELRTVVFFESPHRIAETLEIAAAELGAQRRAAVCRELTKTYEDVVRGELGNLAEHFADGARGELVVVLGPAETATVVDLESAVRRVLDLVATGERLKDAAKVVAAQTGLSRKELYDAAVKAR